MHLLKLILITSPNSISSDYGEAVGNIIFELDINSEG